MKGPSNGQKKESHTMRNTQSVEQSQFRGRRSLLVKVRMQPHKSSPPIVESVALWRSDNDAANGPATSSSEYEAFLLLAYGFSYPGRRMGNGVTVHLKRPSAKKGTNAKEAELTQLESA
ncbi:hypothetical protein CDV55_102128 [Aspergillus turcosus]|nr:hypothetical protein CDV55_102128 [Aspergillus turcosus]